MESPQRDEQRPDSKTHDRAHAFDGGSADPRKVASRAQLAEADPDQAIGLSLTGAMPCISCGYDLQGLSVVGVCPECGAAVRATILAKVDPQAEELAPLLTPRLTACGLGGGVLAATSATYLLWAPRLADAVERFLPVRTPDALRGPALAGLVMALLAVAALSTLTLAHPVRRTTKAQVALTLAALPFFAAMLWAVHRVLLQIDLARPAPYFVAAPSPDRIEARFLFTASVIGALLCVRPAARRLARRSMAMRAGRMNRQTVLAMCGALGVAAIGDGLRLATVTTPPAFDEALNIAGSLLVLAGSALFTLGATLTAIDAVRVARVLLRPAPSLRQVVGNGAGRP